LAGVSSHHRSAFSAPQSPGRGARPGAPRAARWSDVVAFSDGSSSPSTGVRAARAHEVPSPTGPQTTRPAAPRDRSAPPFEERSIERVLERGLLAVEFQPIVDLGSGAVFAYEALARCASPAFPSPLGLIEAAVEQGLVGEVGRAIRRLAVEGCPGRPLFVNVHPFELDEPWIVRTDDPLYAHDAEVHLEVTEAVPLARSVLHEPSLREVRGRGVKLAIDDLGAGYANLRSIAELSPEVVKLDRELVVGIGERGRPYRLVRSIVELCAGLGASCVAEGIETRAELEAARDAGVRFGQGYLLARPANPPPKLASGRCAPA
jgi:EAL domain-containing protein (putative c-di-GMP-specific phosphodiesterase class I)